MTKLARVLNLRDLTLLTIGSVIGSGIFLVPGSVLTQAGGKIGPAMLVWLVGGVLSLLGALTYGELSAVNPKAGGIYVHLRDCFGPLPAFLFGWTLFFAMNGGTIATLSRGIQHDAFPNHSSFERDDKSGIGNHDRGSDCGKRERNQGERRFAELDNRNQGRRDPADVRRAVCVWSRIFRFDRHNMAERV